MKFPSRNDQTAFYDEWNQNYRRGGLNEIDPEIALRGKEILKHLSSLKIKRAKILEVGCGTGWFSQELCRYGAVVGVDLSPKAIEIANSRRINAKFEASDFVDWVEINKNENFTFDIVVCMETLFYVEDQKQFVECMHRMLKPNGLLCTSAINVFVYNRRSEPRSQKLGPVRQWLPRGQLIKLISKKFKIDFVKTVDPRGDLGLLKIVNSHKINSVLNAMALKTLVRRTKEKFGFGAGLIIFANSR